MHAAVSTCNGVAQRTGSGGGGASCKTKRHYLHIFLVVSSTCQMSLGGIKFMFLDEHQFLLYTTQLLMAKGFTLHALPC